MKLKNILLSGLSLVLVAALAIGGTVAYLQDTDEAVNVMTLGNVSIAQHEYERVVENGAYKLDDGSYVLKEFTQGKPLLPSTVLKADGTPDNNGAGNYTGTLVMFEQVGANGGGMDVFTSENAQDKFVFVENTGKTDAYVRTIVAFEAGSLTTFSEWNALISSSYHFAWTNTYIGIAEIDGNNYVIFEYLYNGRPDKGYHNGGVLPAGEVTQCSLAQVYMKAAATNEDMVKLDGNKNGTYDILVFSQAVQAAGFDNAKTALDTAFGKSSEKAAEWFGGVLAENAQNAGLTVENGVATVNNTKQLMELNAILVAGGAEAEAIEVVNLTADIDMTGNLWTPVSSYNIREFNGNNHTISNFTIESDIEYTAMFSVINPEMEKFTVKDLTFDNAKITNLSTKKYTTLLIGKTTVNTDLINVDIKNSNIEGCAYTTSLLGWILNEETTTITVNVKDCEVTNTNITSNSTSSSSRATSGLFGLCTRQLVGPQNNLHYNIELLCENCALTDVKLTTVGKKAEIGFRGGSTGSYEILIEYKGVTLTNVTRQVP